MSHSSTASLDFTDSIIYGILLQAKGKKVDPRIRRKTKKKAWEDAWRKGGMKTPRGPDYDVFGGWHYHPADPRFENWHYYFPNSRGPGSGGLLLLLFLKLLFNEEDL